MLPNPGVQIDERTALVIIDPQVDFLSPEGVSWGVVGESVTENRTVDNIEELLKAAKSADIPCSSRRTTTILTTTAGDSKAPSSS
jgi:nicotinamidase-related amidase